MTAAEAEPALVVADLVAGYVPDAPVVRGCDLSVARGEAVGVIGPNGAGKSTLLRAAFGLVPLTTGAVRLGGRDLAGLAPHERVRAGMAFVPQAGGVFPSLTVAENLRLGSYLDPRRFRARLAAVTDTLGALGSAAHRRAGLLSGGQQRLLAIGRALMSEPDVVLLDEPSAGLSHAAQDDVFAALGALRGSGVSMVVVEHNTVRCLDLCHRAVVVDRGVVAHRGTGAELLEDRRVVELFLGGLGRG